MSESNRTPEMGKVSQARSVDFANVLQKTNQARSAVEGEARSGFAGRGGDASPYKDRIKTAVEDSARKHNLPSSLIYAVIKQESGFNPCAESHCGAQGLMQLMPGTADEMGVTDPKNIEQNIDGGSRYLRQMLDQFDGDPKLALAAYNAGPGRVQESGGIPKIAETQNYVASVLSHYEKFNGSSEIKIASNNSTGAISSDRLLAAADDLSVQSQLLASAAISSKIPLSVKPPKLGKEEPPPPPPPQGVRV